MILNTRDFKSEVQLSQFKSTKSEYDHFILWANFELSRLYYELSNKNPNFNQLTIFFPEGKSFFDYMKDNLKDALSSLHSDCPLLEDQMIVCINQEIDFLHGVLDEYQEINENELPINNGEYRLYSCGNQIHFELLTKAF